MNEEELKLLKKIEELPKELNIEIRGLILAEVCLRIENQKLKSQLQQRDEVINKAKEYIKNHKRNLIHEITHEEYEMLDEENIVNLLEILDNKGE